MLGFQFNLKRKKKSAYVGLGTQAHAVLLSGECCYTCIIYIQKTMYCASCFFGHINIIVIYFPLLLYFAWHLSTKLCNN